MLDIALLVFAHHKGGTGKTTSCLSIAEYLQKDGNRVLMVDCDLQANATAGLGVDPASFKLSIYGVFMSVAEGFPDVGLSDAIISTGSGIDLVPATPDLVGIEPYLYNIDGWAAVLKAARAPVRDAYGFILIGTPPSMGSVHYQRPRCGGPRRRHPRRRDLRPERHGIPLDVLWRRPGYARGRLRRSDPRKGSGEPVIGTGGLAAFEAEVKKAFKQAFAIPYSPEIYETRQQRLLISHYAPESDAGRKYQATATALTERGTKHEEV